MAARVKSVWLSKLISNTLNSGKESSRSRLLSKYNVLLTSKCSLSSNSNVSTLTTGDDKDPLPVFLSEKVQRILRQITGFDIYKINRPRKTAIAPPQYDLLTDEQLKQKEAVADAEARERLEMPPYMKTRKPVDKVLSNDHDIAGVYNSKFVFVDITYGMPDRKRQIVVRDEDGTLRQANWEERDKINQIYNPQEGRKLFTPKMFLPENLELMLSNGQYEYVLDRACVQFEPDHPEYIRVTRRTYEVVDSQKDYEDLRSTRHFGPLAFYLSWHREIDHLLIDMLKRDKFSDSIELVNLYNMLHPESKSAIGCGQLEQSTQQDIQLLEVFAETDSREKGQIEFALQAYKAGVRPDRVCPAGL